MRSQFWGLEDFMNISQTAVTNAVNLAFFMVNLSRRLLGDFRRDQHPQFSILEHRFSNTKNYFFGYSDNEISANDELP